MKDQLIEFCSFLKSEGVQVKNQGDVIDRFVAMCGTKSRKQIIAEAVAFHYDIPLSDLNTQSRKRNKVEPRQVAMYLMDEQCGNYSAIGAFFQDGFHFFDHSTVTHSKKVITALRDTDKFFRKRLEEIEADIKERLGEGESNN